jgi:hypothetical protein
MHIRAEPALGAPANQARKNYGVVLDELVRLCIPLAELLVLFAVPLLVPYWSLVPP